jgi:hypothetical protein
MLGACQQLELAAPGAPRTVRLAPWLAALVLLGYIVSLTSDQELTRRGKISRVDIRQDRSPRAVVQHGLIGGSCPSAACLPSKNVPHMGQMVHRLWRGREFGGRLRCFFPEMNSPYEGINLNA